MPWMTVAENLFLRTEPRGPSRLIKKRELAPRADELFDRARHPGNRPATSCLPRYRSPSGR